MPQVRTFRLALATGLLGLTLAACGGGSDDTTTPDTSAPSSTPSSSATEASPTAAAVDAPFGPGSASVPATGAGSFEGMATAPVATAASANPVLSTLVSAVQAAGLVDTLNSAQDITVFAPSNDAFAKVPAADLQALLADKEMLTQALAAGPLGWRAAFALPVLGLAGLYLRYRRQPLPTPSTQRLTRRQGGLPLASREPAPSAGPAAPAHAGTRPEVRSPSGTRVAGTSFGCSARSGASSATTTTARCATSSATCTGAWRRSPRRRR
jgi:hypothetical protein